MQRAAIRHDGAKVVAKNEDAPTDDPLFRQGTIRPDGRKLHPDLSVRGQGAVRVQGPWDYYKLIGPPRPIRPSAAFGKCLSAAKK